MRQTRFAREVSGPGYGYAVWRFEDQTTWTATLCFRSTVREQHGLTFDDAVDLGERFAHVCDMWRRVQARERVMARGFAVLG